MEKKGLKKRNRKYGEGQLTLKVIRKTIWKPINAEVF